MDYNTFIQTKQDYGANAGFKATFLPDCLMDFQAKTVEKSVRQGRFAILYDCGMGKTLMQLAWAENVKRHTNKPVLILTPLAVSQQTLNEAKKFDIEADRAIIGQTSTKIQVTNYEKLHYFDPADYSGVVCDESSILKNFDGKRRSVITEFMRHIPYRLLCTATAAPNDWIEIGTSSEALGYLGFQDMLTKFFTNKQQSAALMRGRFAKKDEWRLRAYAQEDFWRWVSSWAWAARNPGDLGFESNGFELPPLIENDTKITANKPPEGMLFDTGVTNFFEERELNRRSIEERCQTAADKITDHKIAIAWCHLNDEAKILKKLIPNSVEISGSDSDEKKEEAVSWFCDSTDERRVLISKPKIFGFGMNFQHCSYATYFPTHSYEQYYQATRRIWRYGQTEPVTIDRIYADGGERVLKNLQRKSESADMMFSDLVLHMNNAIRIKNDYTAKEIKLPQWILK